MKRPPVTEEDMRVAELLLSTFQPRLDIIAERLEDAKYVERLNDFMKKKSLTMRYALGDYKPVGPKESRTPVSIELVAEHVAGHRTLGFYPLRADSSCHSVSVDFDNHRGSKTVERNPRLDFDLLSTTLHRHGVRFLGNHSRGGAGYWIHVLTPLGTKAVEARAVMQAIIQEAGVKTVAEGGTIDCLFPKQDRAIEDGPGNLFCLPCSRKWMNAEQPGTHFVGTMPRSMAEQIEYMESL